MAFLWGLFASIHGEARTTVWHPRKAELLGPGGPDDPDA
jgi:hypothetical protein